MSYLANNFAGQTDGDVLTNANSSASGATFTSTSGTAYVFASAATPVSLPAGESKCVTMTVAGASTALWDIDDAAASGSFAVALYVYISSYPSVTATQFPMGFRSIASGALGRLEMDTTGHVRVTAGAGVSAYTTVAVPLNDWWRLECVGTGWGTAATAVDLRLYDEHSTTLQDTVGLSGQTTAATVQRIRYGKFAASPAGAITYRFAHPRQNIGSSSWLGPSYVDLSAVDSSTMSEVATREQYVLIAASDSSTLTDTASLARSSSSTDAFSLTDTASLARASTATDSFSLTESFSEVEITDQNVDDAVLTDTVVALAVDAAAADSFALSEAAAVAGATSATDSATQTEATAVVLVSITATDSATLSEQATLGTGSTPSAVDSSTMSEAASVAADVSAVDSAALTDTAAVAASAARVDGSTLSEVSAVAAGVGAVDTVALTEASAVAVTAARTDTATLTETASVTVQIAATDAAALTDTVQGLLVAVGASDDAFLSESAAVGGGVLARGRVTGGGRRPNGGTVTGRAT